MKYPFIVLINEDFDHRPVVKRYLNAAFSGVSVLTVEGCDQALPLIFAANSRIVIINEHVSELSGIRFAARTISGVGMPVIVVSPWDAFRHSVTDMGVSAFVETGDYRSLQKAVLRSLEIGSSTRFG